MTKLGFMIAIALLSTSALAEPTVSVPQPGNLSIAVAETGATLDWEAIEAQPENFSLEHEQQFEEQVLELNEKIEQRIEQRLEQKLKRELQLDL